MNDEILMPHIRVVTPKDRKLPKFSYSKIEQFLNCPMAFDYKYNQKKQTSDTSLALELGSILHKVLEEKGKMLINRQEINYEMLDNLCENGIMETDAKTREKLLGIEELKGKYWELWSDPDSEGYTYNDKLNTFKNVLKTEMQDDDWTPIAFEQYFEFVWDDKVILHGFIDRVDQRGDEIRVVDYKSSKKVFDDSKLPTSLQFGVYAMACMVLYGKKPVEYLYRFILLDERQKALTLGWEKRLVKKLNKIFEDINSNEVTKRWKPNPSPLCYYCNFCKNNPSAKDFKDTCQYYCLWTPTNKTFEHNKEWSPEEANKPVRKLVF